MEFDCGEQLKSGPAGPVDLDVESAPPSIRFVLPAQGIQALEDVRQEGHSIQALFGPIKEVIQFSGTIGQAEGVERFPGAQGCLVAEKIASMPGPSAHNGLQQEEEGHQRPRPEPRLAGRYLRLKCRCHAKSQRKSRLARPSVQTKGTTALTTSKGKVTNTWNSRLVPTTKVRLASRV